MKSITQANIKLSLICFIACALLLSQAVPWALMITGGLCGWWRLRVAQGKSKLPKARWVKLVLIILIVVTLALSHSADLFGKLVNLVMLGYSLKYIELHQRRDIEIFVLTGFILLALSLVFSSHPIAALLAGVVACLHLCLLLSLDSRLSTAQIKQLGLWLFAISPLSLALFIIIPRLPPLWQMPSPSHAQTGLADKIKPGDISQLVRSDKLVFRAEFTQASSPSGLYWRAMVLDDYDGNYWTRSEQAQQTIPALPAPQNPGQQYQMLLEPSQQAWIATLKPSYPLSPSLSYYADKSWQRYDEKASQYPRQLLEFSYYPVSTAQNLPLSEQQRLTHLPEDIPTRLIRLSQSFATNTSPQQQIAQLQQWFVSQNFVYTLNPPRYPGLVGIEDFLLNQQRGFCVHYAQSAVIIARLLGIPARMVTGYLGGEWEQAQRVLAVRNYDAHAWMEFWDGQQWQRVDPTAWVAPDRVERNLQQSQATAEQWRTMSSWGQRMWYNTGFNQLRLWLAKTDHWWAKWVLNFNQDKQLSLLLSLRNWLPFNSLIQLTSGILGFGLLLSGLVLIRPWRWRLPAKSVRQLRWQLFILSLFKLKMRKGESLEAFAKRVLLQEPQRYAVFKQALKAYQDWHYAPKK